MKKVFNNPAELERLSKENFSVPPFLMMENAARAMADFIISKKINSVYILCGKGNNGGDGYALARLLSDTCQVCIYCLEKPASEEAIIQTEMCQKLGVKIVTDFIIPQKIDAIVDCIYGTGFHSQLKDDIKNLLDTINNIACLKIACDIPSGLYFKSDYTITMGQEKTALYSDQAKAVCGQIIVANLGLPREKFESSLNPDAYLIEKEDLKLPLRKNPSAHKGTYGHTTVFAGSKAGAGIIAASAALNSGSGLTTLLKTSASDLEQFKISPQLMISSTIPEKTNAMVIGPGFSEENQKDLPIFTEWFNNSKEPAAVLDAGIFSLDEKSLFNLLEGLNKVQNAKVVLTPHLSECSRLFSKVLKNHPDAMLNDNDFSVSALSSSAETKLKAGKIFSNLYPQICLVIKSANTFIFYRGQTYICADGCQSLAKGGSGDVLAGMIGSLLSQGYSAPEAAINAVEWHAITSRKIGPEAYSLNPEKLIENL